MFLKGPSTSNPSGQRLLHCRAGDKTLPVRIFAHRSRKTAHGLQMTVAGREVSWSAPALWRFCGAIVDCRAVSIRHQRLIWFSVFPAFGGWPWQSGGGPPHSGTLSRLRARSLASNDFAEYACKTPGGEKFVGHSTEIIPPLAPGVSHIRGRIGDTRTLPPRRQSLTGLNLLRLYRSWSACVPF